VRGFYLQGDCNKIKLKMKMMFKVLVMIRDHLVERKGLKQVERVGLECRFKDYSSRLSSSFGSIKLFFFQVSIKSGSLEKGHFSLVRGLPSCVGETKFGTWKANMEVVIQ
jgi:hypothetical protein